MDQNKSDMPRCHDILILVDWESSGGGGFLIIKLDVRLRKK